MDDGADSVACGRCLGRLRNQPSRSDADDRARAFDYDPTRSSDDEPGFKLDKHRFVPGEYVSFREHDGAMRTFVIARVSDLA